MGKMIQPDFRELHKARRKPVDSETRIGSFLPNAIGDIKAKIGFQWARHGVTIANLKRMYPNYKRSQIEAIVHEHVTKVIQFPGPNGSGPSPAPPTAGRLTNEGGSDDSMRAAKRSTRRAA